MRKSSPQHLRLVAASTHVIVLLLLVSMMAIGSYAQQQQFALVADSLVDYNATQPANGWNYQYRTTSAGSFTNFETYSYQVRAERYSPCFLLFLLICLKISFLGLNTLFH